MSRREWPLRFVCNHPGCTESANYRYSTRRDMMESFELKNYSDGRWRCVRHRNPDEVLSLSNPRTRAEIVLEQKPHGKFFGHFGFISGLGFKAFAEDFPAGTKIIVSAEIVLPDGQEAETLKDVVAQALAHADQDPAETSRCCDAIEMIRKVFGETP